MIEHILKGTNASTLFLITPVVEKDVEVLREYDLIDSYLKDNNREDLEGDLLFVLFRPNDVEFFEMFLFTETRENQNFVEEYDYAGGYIVIVYKIPEWLKDDFEKFKKGEYSKFSKITKDKFKKVVKVGRKTITTIQWDIFSKDPALKKELEEYVGETLPSDIELYELPNMEKETLNINKFRHYVETIEPANRSYKQVEGNIKDDHSKQPRGNGDGGSE